MTQSFKPAAAMIGDSLWERATIKTKSVCVCVGGGGGSHFFCCCWRPTFRCRPSAQTEARAAWPNDLAGPLQDAPVVCSLFIFR